MNGTKLMQKNSRVKTETSRDLRQAIFHTLAFFGMYGLPLRKRRIYELLYKFKADESDVYKELEALASEGKLVKDGERFGLKQWDRNLLHTNREEIAKRWKKIDKYFWIFSLLPFTEYVAVINSLAIGNAGEESDIDFFVITKPDRLYFVRSIIIIIFRLLGIYKTRVNVKERFSFGYYITTNHLNLEKMTLDDDPYLAFWFASHAPILGLHAYKEFVKANTWIYSYFPNYDLRFRERYFRKQPKPAQYMKKISEFLLWVPVQIFEPLIRYVHVRHTFNLPENHWETSSTIAEKDILKLHAIDNRKELRERFYKELSEYKNKETA